MSHLATFDAHTLLIAATRYYIGRMTITTASFAETLAVAWPDIPEHTRTIIQRDLEGAFEDDDRARRTGSAYFALGADCDRLGWERVRQAWRIHELTGGGSHA